MKKVLFCLSIFLFAAGVFSANAQSIIDADEDHNFNDFYKKDQVMGREAMPYAYLREADVVWEHLVWRTVDFREKFNQFFYFPTDPTKDTQGRKNLTNVLMEAWERGDIEGYETDDMFSSNVVDYQTTMSRMTKSDTMMVYEYDSSYRCGSKLCACLASPRRAARSGGMFSKFIPGKSIVIFYKTKTHNL